MDSPEMIDVWVTKVLFDEEVPNFCPPIIGMAMAYHEN